MFPSEWTIRPVATADAAAIDTLIAAMAAEIGDATAKRSSAESFAGALRASPPLLRGVIAECENMACGLCLWLPWFSTWHGTPGVFVQDLYVAAIARRKGLARALLAEAARRGRQDGAAFLRLDVHRANGPGLALYESLGFDRGEDLTMRLFGPAFEAMADIPASDNSRR